ncbi:MAG: diguanylate cyclase [Sphaerochaetaceae bacterium]|jgi:diguanylate cyclase (GGDEF)-like protein/PAS domain S-box-containing protein|nr:diguanylate cyclase [Sphaerochaetaceae bacterium]
MRRSGNDLSIRDTTIIVFVLIMIVAVSIIASLIFSRWHRSAEATVGRIAFNISETIHDRIASFMETPLAFNESNHKIIQNGILDLEDEEQRDRYFVGALMACTGEIYSFSYGSEAGEYYGARRNERGEIEIMRNNASTGGNSWYYTVDDEMRAHEIAVKLGPFDPTTRAWYQGAKNANGPAFSPVYKHFVMDDLTVSVAIPVQDRQGAVTGVMGTHLLLSGIGDFLETSVAAYSGSAIIVERDTGYLIANSMGMRNFKTNEDGTLARLHVEDLHRDMLAQAYARFLLDGESQRILDEGGVRHHVHAQEFAFEGVDWIVISAITGDFLLDEVERSILITVVLLVLTILVAIVIYRIVAKRLFRPVDELLRVSAELSAGELSKRVPIVRNDEIGSISRSLNEVANNLERIFDDLEGHVEARTRELHEANSELARNHDRLQLILDSTAEGVYGIDREGRCTFCNHSSIRMLGYGHEEELLGHDMHEKIHHSLADGTPFPLDACRIFRSITEGRGYEAEDEVFWKKDGTSFPVAYHAFPQIREGQVIGGVITFMDITERRHREQQIEYLRSHDLLTGVYNRSYFEEHLQDIDIPENLPLSIIFADINALKMTNDIFGHQAGDELIRVSARILGKASRDTDIIARFGGDEFVVIMPRTTEEQALRVITKIRNGFSEAQVEAMRCSISLGAATKVRSTQVLSDTLANAENGMYKDKAANRNTVNSQIIESLLETLHARSPHEKRHSHAVCEIATDFGSALGLPEDVIRTLARCAYLHDIGKITLDPSLLSDRPLTAEEMELMRQHSVAGFRILNLFDDTLDVAEYVYSHHERWDGGGYPRGLQEEEIPYISRILAIVEAYERMINRTDLPLDARKPRAIDEIRKGAGTQFDPQLACAFITMMSND